MTLVLKRSGRISLTAALIGNIALLTLIIGGLCAWLMAQWGMEDIRKEESKRLAMTAGGIASQISLAMEERQNEVRRLRDLFEREMRDAPTAYKRQVMERLQAGQQHFSWMGVVADDGRILIGTSGLLEGVSVAGRNWFEGARQSPVYFGNIHPAKLLNQYIQNADGAPLYLLDIALPLHDGRGAVSGVVGSHFNWRMIEDVVRHAQGAQRHSADLAVAIVSADGTILFDSRGTAGNVANLVERATPGAMMEALWPHDESSTFFSVVPVPAGKQFDGLGWQIVVREPASIIGAGIARMKWQVAAASLFAGLLFALLGIIAVRPITRPLQALVVELKAFGDTGAVPKASYQAISEVANLHQAFIAMATDVQAQREMLNETQAEIVRTLGRAGEFRDNETGNHVLRMSLCCERLALLAGWDESSAAMLRLASQMHDVGKIGIPDHVLLKPGRFDAAERALMERHSEIGARILAGIDTPLTVMARTIALTHHEKWDGSGYPHRLAGTDIPQEGRIAALCDAFDALLSSRPYKDAWSIDRVASFISEQSGRHFDPELAKILLGRIDEFTAIREGFCDEPSIGGNGESVS